MRWLVTGGAGMLARDLVERIQSTGGKVTAVDKEELDIVNVQECCDAVENCDVVVNCAAWTAVDDAENHESESFLVNAVGAANLAAAAERSDARMIQISTDYVFGGQGRRPYRESDPVDPQSAYGRTKLAGEWGTLAHGADHMVVRTSWLYSGHGSNFPKTIARLARERGSLEVVNDQWGAPTWTRDLARVVCDLIAVQAPGGIYHATAGGATTWWDFARTVVDHIGLDPQMVRPIDSAGSKRRAPRPAWSVLDSSKLASVGVHPIDEWSARWAVAAAQVLRSQALSSDQATGDEDGASSSRPRR